MYLSKIWSKSKGPILPLLTSIAPSIIGIWNFDFQKLSPDVTLSSQAIYSTQVELTIWFLLIVAFLLSCVFLYSLAIIIKDKKASKEELADTVRSIRETVENNYTIHERDVLNTNIRKTLDEEASKGSRLPQGLLAGRLFDIHLNEVSIFTYIVREVSLSFAENSTISLSSTELLELFNELLIGHNTIIKNYHNSMAVDLFGYNDSSHAKTMVDNFNKQADIETKLRCKELLSALKIKNTPTCSTMVFPLWEPIKKKESQKHHYFEEGTI